MLKDVSAQLVNGCGMNHCAINPPKGIAPNGGCRCSRDQVQRNLEWITSEVRAMTREDWKDTTTNA